MNRRKLKKELRTLSAQLLPLTMKYLAASPKVQKDVSRAYENQLETYIFQLLQRHLILDNCWPHKARWLDGYGEDFLWNKGVDKLVGRGELFWGHWPKAEAALKNEPLTVEIEKCRKHGLDYVLKFGDGENARLFSNRRGGVCRKSALIRQRI